MKLIVPAFLLLSFNIAGSQVLLVPFLAQQKGAVILPTLCLAYLGGNLLVSGLSSWVGWMGRHELFILVRRLFGSRGRTLLAVAVLLVSLPASAVTGGIFGSALLQVFVPWPSDLLNPFIIVLCALLSQMRENIWLRPLQYGALLVFPCVAWAYCQNPVDLKLDWQGGSIDWTLVLALVSYSSGGIRPALIVEAAAYLRRKGYHTLGLLLLTKILEGIFTLGAATLVIAYPVTELPALSLVMGKMLGSLGEAVMSLVLICVVCNVMIPAMTVNARQLAYLFSWSEGKAVILTGALVYFLGLLDIAVHIQVMSFTGLVMIILLAYVAVAIKNRNLS